MFMDEDMQDGVATDGGSAASDDMGTSMPAADEEHKEEAGSEEHAA